ncbi:hypothetical protein [Nocardioides sp. NPDC006273]|uniref:hypothetical protein n=1 Tax=Nocardioides sp. NPDC006273 TaxID=3155598 RepID=UPI0033BE1EE0
MTDRPCQSCEQLHRELQAERERTWLLVRGLATVLALLDAEQIEPSMAKRRVLAIVHHRLTHLMTQTNGRTRR